MREVNMQPLQIRYMTMEQSLNNQSGNNLTQKLFQKVRSAPNVRLKMHPSSSICCLPLIWFRVTGGLRLFWVERWGTPCTGDQAIAELTQTDNCSHSYSGVHEENPHRQRGNNQTPHRKASTSQWIVRHNTVLQYFFLFFYISTKVKYFREMLTVMLTDSGKKNLLAFADELSGSTCSYFIVLKLLFSLKKVRRHCAAGAGGQGEKMSVLLALQRFIWASMPPVQFVFSFSVTLLWISRVHMSQRQGIDLVLIHLPSWHQTQNELISCDEDLNVILCFKSKTACHWYVKC